MNSISSTDTRNVLILNSMKTKQKNHWSWYFCVKKTMKKWKINRFSVYFAFQFYLKFKWGLLIFVKFKALNMFNGLLKQKKKVSLSKSISFLTSSREHNKFTLIDCVFVYETVRSITHTQQSDFAMHKVMLILALINDSRWMSGYAKKW